MHKSLIFQLLLLPKKIIKILRIKADLKFAHLTPAPLLFFSEKHFKKGLIEDSIAKCLYLKVNDI